MNFSFVLKAAKDGSYGAKKTDGSWSGMIGALNNRECDMGKYVKCPIEVSIFLKHLENVDLIKISRQAGQCRAHVALRINVYCLIHIMAY